MVNNQLKLKFHASPINIKGLKKVWVSSQIQIQLNELCLNISCLTGLKELADRSTTDRNQKEINSAWILSMSVDTPELIYSFS